MYAVIKTGGKQYRVSQGDEVRFEKLDGSIGDTINFEQVLLTSDSKRIKIGEPYIKNSKVVGRITRHGKNKKIIVFKYKRRKGYSRKQGHRQDFTLVKIENIETKVKESKPKG